MRKNPWNRGYQNDSDRIRTTSLLITSPTLDYRLATVAAESTENLWYLLMYTVASPDPNPRGGGQLPNPKSAILR